MSNEQKSVIELRELRIGNYLLYKGELVHVTTLSLDVDDESEDTIGFCKFGQIHNETADWNRALYNDLERISLTKEWLEKFGFIEGILVIEILLTHIRAANNYTEVRYCDAYGNSVSRYFQYVHQLQNLFYALTGEELKLKGQ